MQYSETTIYGNNLILKNYAHFPRFLPLPCHFEHGWTAHTEALSSDLGVDKPLMLVYSQRRKMAWNKAKKTPAYIMGSPFIHYKNILKISKSSTAKGAVVFPSHSTQDTKSCFDVRGYCEKLQGLPLEFHPLTICLFWPDFKDKNAQIYREFGFKVTSAGRFKRGLGFVKNFYRIISRHKYATSNEIGSYTFYAVDLNIPFFLFGERPLCKNIGSNQDMRAAEKLDEMYYGRQAIKMFSTGPTTEISSLQAKFVEEEIGEKNCLTREDMNKLLWKFYKKDKNHFKGAIIYWGISILLWLGIAGFVKSTFNGLKRKK